MRTVSVQERKEAPSSLLVARQPYPHSNTTAATHPQAPTVYWGTPTPGLTQPSRPPRETSIPIWLPSQQEALSPPTHTLDRRRPSGTTRTV